MYTIQQITEKESFLKQKKTSEKNERVYFKICLS